MFVLRVTAKFIVETIWREPEDFFEALYLSGFCQITIRIRIISLRKLDVKLIKTQLQLCKNIERARRVQRLDAVQRQPYCSARSEQAA